MNNQLFLSIFHIASGPVAYALSNIGLHTECQKVYQCFPCIYQKSNSRLDRLDFLQIALEWRNPSSQHFPHSAISQVLEGEVCQGQEVIHLQFCTLFFIILDQETLENTDSMFLGPKTGDLRALGDQNCRTYFIKNYFIVWKNRMFYSAIGCSHPNRKLLYTR